MQIIREHSDTKTNCQTWPGTMMPFSPFVGLIQIVNELMRGRVPDPWYLCDKLSITHRFQSYGGPMTLTTTTASCVHAKDELINVDTRHF